MHQYYALYTCDAWKSKSTYRLAGVLTERNLKKTVKILLRKGIVAYDGSIKDIDNMDFHTMQSRISYLSIEQITLNNLLL